MDLSQWLSPHLRAGNRAAAQRFHVDGRWHRRTYGELHDLVRRTARGLQLIGARRGDRVAIIARTRPEWTVVDLASALLGSAVVPIYPTASNAQIGDILRRTTPTVLVADPDRDLPPISPEITVLRFGELAGDPGDLAFPEISAGDGPTGDATEVAGSDLYSIVFSSGSTGAPKGCPLTHDNYVSVLRMAAEVELDDAPAPAHRERAFVFLPLAHVSARLQQLTTFTLGGELIYGEGGTAEILEQIREVEPTYVPGMPRLFESANLRAGRDPERLREMFGPSLHYALTGGAPIDPDMLRTYAAAGIPLVEGYGLTETSAALTLCAPHCNRSGSVGRALPGVELRIAADGEMIARGPNIFAGYLDAPELTRDAFIDGWFRTGDLGAIDDDGFVYITGRKKNLIVTSTGKNVAPEPMENQLRAAFGIPDVVVVGDRRPYLIALVFCGDAVHEGELVGHVRRANADLAPPERVRKLVIVPRALRLGEGELTASGKIVRSAAISLNSLVVDGAYGAGAMPGIHVIDIEGAAHRREAS